MPGFAPGRGRSHPYGCPLPHRHPIAPAHADGIAPQRRCCASLAGWQRRAPGYAGRALDDVLREFSLAGPAAHLQRRAGACPVARRAGAAGRNRRRGPAAGARRSTACAPMPWATGIYAIVRAPARQRSLCSGRLAGVAARGHRGHREPLHARHDVPDVHTFLTQTRDSRRMPRFADDALKAVHRLPGAASNGAVGARAHAGRRGERNAGGLRRPAAVRAVPPQLLQSPISVLD